jgi:hypothetical protein
MGAQVKLDLTSDVTHLIVGNTNSAKYRYVAKAREDVKVLSPEWMHAVQKVWMAGEDVNTSKLEEQWTLPTFYGLKICLTGFDNRTIATPIGSYMLIAHSRTTQIYTGDRHRERRRVPRRSDKSRHTSYRGSSVGKQVRACRQLAYEDRHMGMVRAEPRTWHGFRRGLLSSHNGGRRTGFRSVGSTQEYIAHAWEAHAAR